MISHTQRYEAAWKDLRLRTFILLGLFIGFVPGAPLLVYAINALFSVDPLLWVGGGWGAAFLGAGIHRSTFPCPRCGQWFFMWYGFGNPLSRKCMHCGLKIGARYEAGQISN